jgi:hypothetical protein
MHALNFSKQFMFAHHLLCKVTLESRDGGDPKEQFDYDRYPDLERIKMRKGYTYARKRNGKWLKSDNWAESGSAVDSTTASELDRRVELAQVAWVTSIQSHDTAQGGNIIKIVAREKIKADERVIFERTREHPTNPPYPRYTFIQFNDVPKGDMFIEEVSAPIVFGDQKLFVTVHYVPFIELKNARVIIKRGSPGPKH